MVDYKFDYDFKIQQVILIPGFNDVMGNNINRSNGSVEDMKRINWRHETDQLKISYAKYWSIVVKVHKNRSIVDI